MNAQATLSHRERLMREGTKLLYAHGYHGTSVDSILAASGVPKGSFYHHFGSKEAFALDALDRYMRFQHDLLAKWADRTDLATADALVGYFQDMAAAFVRSRHQRGCLLGKLATETAPSSPAFRKALGEHVRTWQRQLSDLLERGRERGDVRTDVTVRGLADSVLALVQGAFVVALAVRDQAMLDATAGTLRLLVAA
ncbi:MAG TPA: TetR/AcrR family transcriptional regulator [Pseudonocardiaceae bacterium]|nr:TetR/AcrR family transcriptional regulator [Pseudonocardiaceae bacterium]